MLKRIFAFLILMILCLPSLALAAYGQCAFGDCGGSSGGGSGDITSVWDDTTGAVTDPTIQSGQSLTAASGSTVTADSGASWVMNGSLTGTGTLDMSAGNLEIPNSTTLPATCEAGEVYMDTNATSGQQIYGCEGGSWVLQGDGGAGGGATTDTGTVIHLNDLTADFVVGGTLADSTSAAYIDESAGSLFLNETNSKIQVGNGTDRTQTVFEMNLASTNWTLGFNSATMTAESNYHWVTTGTATIDDSGVQLVARDTAVTTGTMDAMWTVTENYNTWLFHDIICSVHDQGVTGSTDITVYRRRAGVNAEILSTDVTIGAEQFAQDGVVNTANDDLQTGDILLWNVTGVHTTPPNGLDCSFILWSE